ncbi:MAG TPA: class I SAM-dependent methyltransferase [Pseudonocardiaceae bacterium]|nr:class I SAM-dependent methyltransferase [Pseudonocardiaceae bacterium]
MASSDDGRQCADAAGKSAIIEADLDALPTAIQRLDVAALLAIAATVHELSGLPPDTVRTADQIAEAMGTAARHRWIVRYWLELLTAEQLLVRDDDRRYQDLRPTTQHERAAADAALDSAGTALGYTAELTRFFRTANENLPGLLRDDVLPQALLFPGGDITTALSFYQDNTVSRYLNAAVAEVVRHTAEERTGALQVLELGAGVGGTTAAVLASLADRKVNYSFTDVSRFFLNIGRERFGGHPGLRYVLVDINGELPGQGIPAGKTDVVIAANVIHNAHHVGRMMANLRRLLAPDGLLVIVELCREYHQGMTSVRFLASPPSGQPRVDRTDIRAEDDRILLTRQEWLDQLLAAGLQPLFDLPYPDDKPLAALAQHLFVATPATFERSNS